ncbi:putative nucleotidyltransferase [Actinokineospora baliensis]|uniref:nucleotidyltransferase family protein n=1 Tax=Actinokineospora baliensis TaxID=547056 RepID=UPI00195C133C|nr:nucleotidyltransferase domain-containing protein [Actinokineospora baliensis]MBM7770179.1 putative nucleotidyltransferase [Actinokineospora baliensis]
MHELVAARLPQIEDLCRRTGVRRLDLFGSALGVHFNPATSDVDVLVEFVDGPEFDAFFSLKEGLEALLGRPVDVVTTAGLRNPYFRQQVLETRETLYAAACGPLA